MGEQIIMHRMCKVLDKETKKGAGILMKKVIDYFPCLFFFDIHSSFVNSIPIKQFF